MLDRRPVASRTATTPLVGGDIEDYAAFIRGAGGDAAGGTSRERLSRLYGTERARVEAIAAKAQAHSHDQSCVASSAKDNPPLPREEQGAGGSRGVLSLVMTSPAVAQPLGATCPVLGAEIAFAVREEMAVHLTDALLRRTDAGSAGHPGADALENAARMMGGMLGWSDDRRREEIAAIERVYTIEG
jgi:glycerol-3-phosphate dehydrogenase